MRVCTVCRHTEASTINGLLTASFAYRFVAALVGLSKDAMYRHHKGGHIPPGTPKLYALPSLEHPPGGSLYYEGEVPPFFNQIVERASFPRLRLWYAYTAPSIPGLTESHFKALQSFGYRQGLWTLDYDGITIEQWFREHVYDVQSLYFEQLLEAEREARKALRRGSKAAHNAT